MTIWPYAEVGHNQDAKREVKVFNSDNVFATPKPEKLIERIIQDAKYLCEPKRASEMQNSIVLKKRKAAVQWCRHATHYSVTHDGKPWYYVLIPHDSIKANSSFEGLCAEFTIS